MSEIPRYLPLSQRPRRDETGVSNNWSAHLATTLTQLADLIESKPATTWTAPASLPGASIGSVVTAADAYLGSTLRQRLRHRLAPRFRNGSPAAGRSDVVARLRARAVVARQPESRVRLGELAVAVVASYDVAAALGTEITIDPIASGAVALARSLSAPLPVRAVTRGTTLVADDAGWRVGTGPAVTATASVIVLFLYGRGGVPA